MTLKTDLLPKFDVMPNYSSWESDLIKVDMNTLILASLKVCSFSVSEIVFYVIIFWGARFLSVTLALRVPDACSTSQNLPVHYHVFSLSPVFLPARAGRLKLVAYSIGIRQSP